MVGFKICNSDKVIEACVSQQLYIKDVQILRKQFFQREKGGEMVFPVFYLILYFKIHFFSGKRMTSLNIFLSFIANFLNYLKQLTK